MKKNLVIVILMMIFVGIATDVSAQKGKGGKGTKNSKGGKKGGKKDTTPAPVDPTTTPPPAAAPAASTDVVVPGDDEGAVTSDAIVAEVDSFDFKEIVLDTAKPTDGYLKLANLKGAKPFPLPKQDKNSVKPYKRIWREINVADSENRIFSMPGETLIQFIMDGIKNGKLIAYEDEGFKKKMSYKKVMGQFRDSSVIIYQNALGEDTGSRTVANEFNPDSVTTFEIKEDIFLDKVRGRIVTEIIGLGVVKHNFGKGKTAGVDYGDTHPFYLNFKQCRNLFAAREVVDLEKGLNNISFDDIFIQHNFKSIITKQSSASNRKIKDIYPDKERQIKESNRIEREIQRYKRNMWKFS